MEKRNFVTSARTPDAGVSDIDDVLEVGAKAFGRRLAPKSDVLVKRASAEDEKSDTPENLG